MTRFSTFLTALLALTAPLAGQTVHNIWQPPLKQGIAAQVEDRIITFEELRREMAPLVPRIRQESRSEQEFNQKMDELYLEILQSLIDRHIIVKAFQKKEYQMPQTFVENEFDRILIEDFNNDRASFLQHLQAQGKNVREFRRELRERIIVSAMRGEMRKSVSEVSPERISKYYEENKLSFYEDEAVKLRLIMLRPIGDESRDLMRQQAEKILERLDDGERFEDLARELSQDNRRSRGGDWGWVTKKDLREELANAAFGLLPGEHSDPVFLGNQVFILYVEEHRPEGVQPLSEVREEIEEILAGQLSRQAQRAWLERLRKDAFVRYM